MKPLSIENSLMKAKSLSKKGQLDESINILQLVLKNFPNNLRVQKALQNIITLNNKSANKEIPENEFNRLYSLYNSIETNKFLYEADRILKQYPDNFTIWNLVGIVKAKNGQISDASNCFHKVIELNPNFPDGYNNLGNILVQQGKFDEAKILFEKVLSLKPLTADVLNNVGTIFEKKGDFENAIANYKKAILIKPNYIDALNNIGNSFHRLGQTSEAIDNLKKVILLDPSNTLCWNSIAYPMRSIDKLLANNILLDLQKEKKLLPQEININILKYKIFRSVNISDDFFNLLIESFAKVKNSVIKSPVLPVNTDKIELNLPQNIFSLVHFGRSGTGLMHSLIDNHPQISTLPSIYFSEYFDHSTWEKITIGGWDSIVDNFIKIYDVLFDARSNIPIKAIESEIISNIGVKEGMTNVGDNKDQYINVDKNKFREQLKSLLSHYKEMNQMTFFKLFHLAYERTLRNFEKKNIIFYHIHNPDVYSQFNLAQYDKNISWIMMVREPIQSCESWLRSSFNNNNYEECVNRITKMIVEIDNIVYKKNKSIGVRLEDLKKHPQKTMSALCKWMGIEENENLYQMTMQGKKWWGDPSSPDYKFDGMNPFGKMSIERKIGSIFSENDQFILSTLFYPFSVQFGYVKNDLEKFKIDLNKIKPMLDDIFDFERILINRTNQDVKSMMLSGIYKYFRTILKDRWNILNEYNTYPNMIKPLKID